MSKSDALIFQLDQELENSKGFEIGVEQLNQDFRSFSKFSNI